MYTPRASEVAADVAKNRGEVRDKRWILGAGGCNDIIFDGIQIL